MQVVSEQETLKSNINFSTPIFQEPFEESLKKNSFDSYHKILRDIEDLQSSVAQHAHEKETRLDINEPDYEYKTEYKVLRSGVRIYKTPFQKLLAYGYEEYDDYGLQELFKSEMEYLEELLQPENAYKIFKPLHLRKILKTKNFINTYEAKHLQRILYPEYLRDVFKTGYYHDYYIGLDFEMSEAGYIRGILKANYIRGILNDKSTADYDILKDIALEDRLEDIHIINLINRGEW
jgi:hypothetical protein